MLDMDISSSRLSLLSHDGRRPLQINHNLSRGKPKVKVAPFKALGLSQDEIWTIVVLRRDASLLYALQALAQSTSPAIQIRD